MGNRGSFRRGEVGAASAGGSGRPALETGRHVVGRRCCGGRSGVEAVRCGGGPLHGAGPRAVAVAWNAGWMARDVVGLGTSVRPTSRPFHVKLCAAGRRAVARRSGCVCPARRRRREQARQDTRTGWRRQATQSRVRCRPRRGSAWSYFETIDHAMERLVGRGAKPRSVHSQARLAPRNGDPGSPAEREHPRASLATPARSDVANQRNSARSHSGTRVLVKPCAAGCGTKLRVFSCRTRLVPGTRHRCPREPEGWKPPANDAPTTPAGSPVSSDRFT